MLYAVLAAVALTACSVACLTPRRTLPAAANSHVPHAQVPGSLISGMFQGEVPISKVKQVRSTTSFQAHLPI